MRLKPGVIGGLERREDVIDVAMLRRHLPSSVMRKSLVVSPAVRAQEIVADDRYVMGAKWALRKARARIRFPRVPRKATQSSRFAIFSASNPSATLAAASD